MSVYTSTQLTTDHGSREGVKPSLIVLHHAAMTSLPGLIGLMMPGGRTVSAHAAIGGDEIVNVVPEDRRSYSLGAAVFERRVLSAECVNSAGAPGWPLSDATHESIARWVADVATRHGIKPHRDGDPKGWTVIGHREVYTVHGQSYATACPGGMRLDAVVARAQEIIAEQIEENNMAQGAFFRNGTTGYVYWQEKPNTPLMHVSAETWAGYREQGNKWATLTADAVDGLIAKWGLVESPVVGGAGASPSQIAKAVDAELKDDFAGINANVNKPRTLQ